MSWAIPLAVSGGSSIRDVNVALQRFLDLKIVNLLFAGVAAFDTALIVSGGIES